MKRITMLMLLVTLLIGCGKGDSLPIQGDCEFIGPLEPHIEQPNDC